MDTEETKDREKANSPDSGFAPMGQGMFEMMNKCCAGKGGFPECSAMMKSMMDAARNQSCCSPKKEDLSKKTES